VNALRYGVLGVSDVPVGVALSFVSALTTALVLAAMMQMAGANGIRGDVANSQK
jgi:hypothetical protein